MTEEKNAKRQTPQPEPKDPSALPGPNRQADTDRYGEALAPGTVPDDERKKRERRTDESEASKRP